MKAALKRRGADGRLDSVLKLDSKRRDLLQIAEDLRAEQNRASEEIGLAKREGKEPEKEITAMKQVAQRLKSEQSKLSEVETELEQELAQIPNLPDPTAAQGMTEEDSEEIRTVGERPEFDFELKDHLEIGTKLGVIDMERAANTSGSRFAYLLGGLVNLELALIQYSIGKLSAKGFKPVIPPALVREQAMFATGFLPTDENQIYRTADDDLYLVGTSEVSLASLHMDEVIDEERLPIRYAGFSPCFRREAGAAGKDTRGIFRVHQFDKVEMYSFCHPEKSKAEHEFLLSIEEEILSELEIPYRVVNVAVGDLGASAAKKYDCEAWMPGQGRYREVTSTSNTTDYQARRLSCRFRSDKGKPQMVHTLNGTAVAVGRTIIAIMENQQQPDGSVLVPEVLQNFGAPKVLDGA